MILPYYPAPEPFDQEDEFCDDCTRRMVNPLCPSCLTTEIHAWMTLYPDLKTLLFPRVNEYLRTISHRITSYGMRCVKCGEHNAVVCPHCFSDFVFDELKKINAGPLVVQEFSDFFQIKKNKQRRLIE
jgi:hypothetical protein